MEQYEHALTEQDNELITLARRHLEQKYHKPLHTVAAALRMADGHIIMGLNFDHFSGSICAEVSALTHAMNRENYAVQTVVAVRRNTAGEYVVANMCGKCRQIFHDYVPQARIIVDSDGSVEVRSIEELLPLAFYRHREKINDAMQGISDEEIVG